MKNCIQQHDKSYRNRNLLSVAGQILIAMKNCCQQQDKPCRNAQTSVTCFTALLFHRHVSVLYDKICSTGCQLFAIRSDLFRQRCMKQQRSEATSRFTYITIRLVLLLTTIFHYYMICPATDNKFLLPL